MSTIRETNTYSGLSADQAYKMAETALEDIGFDVWKKRPLGWLLMADFQDEIGKITGNVSCRPGAGASITITLDSDLHEDSLLAELSGRVFSWIESASNSTD